MNPIDAAALLVVLAAVLGFFNHTVLRLPHTIGLTIMGAAASLLVVLTDKFFLGTGLGEALRELVQGIDFHAALMEGMLSFLLFAGALHVDLTGLLKRKWTVGIMATLGVVISTVLVGVGFKATTLLFGIDLSLLWCLAFGALISPTDPVAVLGILKSANVPPSLEAKVVGESLFNDGVGIVVFTIFVAAAIGTEDFSIVHAGEIFVVEALGGVVFGLVLGWVAFRAMEMINDHNLEVLITLALVMGGYALAHRLHISGPVAMAVAGLLIGNYGIRRAKSGRTREHLHGFWSLLDEVLNSVLFLLIGLEVLVIAPEIEPIALGLVAIVIVLAARGIAVGLPYVALRKLAPFTRGAYPILVWGGLRGGISIALALSLPPGETKDLILTATYVVVLFSVIVQGATIGTAAKRFVRDAE